MGDNNIMEQSLNSTGPLYPNRIDFILIHITFMYSTDDIHKVNVHYFGSVPYYCCPLF